MENTPIEAYEFCPKCSEKLEHKGQNHLKCTACKFNFFINQAPTIGLYILNKNNQVLLGKRAFEPHKGTWDNIGGFVNLDEDLVGAAQREAEEELGVKIKLGEYLGSYSQYYPHQEIQAPMLNIDFIAYLEAGEPKAADDVAEIKWFTIEEALLQDICYESIKQSLKLIQKKLITKN